MDAATTEIKGLPARISAYGIPEAVHGDVPATFCLWIRILIAIVAKVGRVAYWDGDWSTPYATAENGEREGSAAVTIVCGPNKWLQVHVCSKGVRLHAGEGNFEGWHPGRFIGDSYTLRKGLTMAQICATVADWCEEIAAD